jgi:hypothetical protein
LHLPLCGASYGATFHRTYRATSAYFRPKQTALRLLLIPRSKANLKTARLGPVKRRELASECVALRLRGMGHQLLAVPLNLRGSSWLLRREDEEISSHGFFWTRKVSRDRARDTALLWLVQTISRQRGSSAPASRAAEKHDGRRKCHNKPQSPPSRRVPHELVSQWLVCACNGVDHGF